MFSKINPYFIPILFFIPQKVFNGAYSEFNNNKNENLTHHVLYFFMGGYCGLLEGVFLGLLWPITIPIMIKRYIDKN